MSGAKLTLGLRSATVTASLPGDRILAGTVLPYGEVGRTALGELTVDGPGRVALPEDRARVKLFSEHGRETPVGYALDALDQVDGLRMTWRIGSTPAGDLALLEATEHVRDALSVELSDVVIADGHLISATLDAVALTALGAYPSARLAAGLDQEGNAMTSLEPATLLAEPTPPAIAAAAPDVPPAQLSAAAPAGTLTAFSPPAPLRASRSNGPNRPEAVRVIAAALTGARDASQVNAALSDIVPADDAGLGYLRPQWIDELWTPRVQDLFLRNAVASGPLTGNPVQGWRWKTYPAVGDYAGNKAEIPSNKAQTEPAQSAVYRLAGGWDVDRIYTDFNTGMVDSLLSAASFDLALKVEAKIGTALLAAAPIAAPTDPGPVAAIVAAASAVLANGAAVTFIGVAPDVFAALLPLNSLQVPAWISGNLSLPDGSGNLGGLAISMTTGIPAGMVIAGNRQAMTHYETPTISIQAVNLPNGGIDVALFYYAADLVHSTKGLAQATMTAAPLSARSSK